MKKPSSPTHRKTQAAAAPSDTALHPSTDDAPGAARGTFPIVGIGASAGGLEALEAFVRNVPKDSGMAFVIVQHLDPTHKGIMAELLQRATPMKVAQVKDRTQVQPDHVYVIPPNKDMSILHGVLHLLDPVAPRGLRLPVDLFLRSLADDAEERSIGVILSGMGSDGTLGLKAIKGKAGVVFVQDPASAKFDGMPRSAIDAGLVDVVAPVEALPGKIVAYLQHVPLMARTGLSKEDANHSGFEKIVILLRAQTGHDFSLYKKNTVYRRIERRMGIHQVGRIGSYVRFLQENPQELELLFKELLIGVTSFFRDPATWEQLGTEVIPTLLHDRPANQALRIWVPACATGEEAFSLAILFREVLERLDPTRRQALQIFATDLDRDAIDKARAGLFSANIAADVSPERLSRFFVGFERGYQVSKPIREAVIFAPQNIIMDPPFTKLDLLSCRNLLIYLTPELQRKLLPLFHYSLNPGGILVLGNAETIGEFSHLFAPLDGKTQIFRRLESGPQAEPVEFPAAFATTRTEVPPKALPPAISLQSHAEQLLLQRFSPAAVLVNAVGDILFINGRTGKYLEPGAGKANWNIFAMAREGLGSPLSIAFRQALRQADAVTRRDVKVGTNGGVQVVDLTVQAIAEPRALRGLVLVVFTDVPTPPETKGPARGRPPRSTRTATLERDFDQIQQELQTTREEMQTFQEEAKSSHEELQSTNEELQSTNEELTTSKEEMQAMNEELQTLNGELQRKMGGLARINDDQRNLLDSVDIGILFLDAELRVRSFTAGACQVFRLIASDVGRTITDLATNLDYPTLADDMRGVLRTLAVHETAVPALNGSWFRLRIKAYRTTDDRIDGLAVTTVDITETKRKEGALRRLAVVVRDARDAITVQDTEGRIMAWNPSAVRIYGWTEAEALAMNVRDRIPEGLRQIALATLQQLSQTGTLEPYRTQRIAKDGTIKEVTIISSALVNESGQTYAISTTERMVGGDH